VTAVACLTCADICLTIGHVGAGLNGPRALQQTINTCFGTNEPVWFNSTLVFPNCEAFVILPLPDFVFDLAPAPAPSPGITLGGNGYAVFTTAVQGGCGTQLPVLCLGTPPNI